MPRRLLIRNGNTRPYFSIDRQAFCHRILDNRYHTINYNIHDRTIDCHNRINH